MTVPPLSPAGLADVATRPLHDGAPPKLAHLPEGTNLDRYIVLEHVGSGGMGAVYRVHDAKLKREVALKLVLFDDPQHGAPRHDRVLAEARAMAKVTHPNVLPIHDVELFEDAVCIAMEYVDGTTLDTWLAQSSRDWREILDVLEKAGRGLAAAHAAGLVHGDFKPQNVLVGRDGRVRVSDFGLARAVDDEPAASSPGTDTAPSSSPRRWPVNTHMVYGTPHYMAPERHAGHPGEARSDQYSFCVTLYEALYGALPDAATTRNSSRRRSTGAPASTSNANTFALAERVHRPAANESMPSRSGSRRAVPRWLEAALARGLERDLENRWPTMSALLDALARDPAVTRRRTLVTAAIVSAAALTLFLLPDSRGGPTILPDEPEVQTSVATPPRLELARQAILRGEHTDAQTLLAAMALESAEEATNPWDAAVALEQGNILRFHNLALAIEHDEKAYFHAMSAGQLATAITAATELASRHNELDDPATALAWVRHGRSALALASHLDRGEPPHARHRLDVQASFAHALAGQTPDDSPTIARALTQFEHDNQPLEAARALSVLGEIERMRARPQQASAFDRRAWVLASTVLPAGNAELLALELMGAADLLATDQPELAASRMERFESLHAERLPTALRDRAWLLAGLAAADLGRVDAAWAKLERLTADDIYTHSMPSPWRASMQHTLARLHVESPSADAAAGTRALEALGRARTLMDHRRETDNSTSISPAPGNVPGRTFARSWSLLRWTGDQSMLDAVLATDEARATYLVGTDRSAATAALRHARARLVQLGAQQLVLQLDRWLAAHDIVLETPVAARRTRAPAPRFVGTSSDPPSEPGHATTFVDERIAR